MIRYYHDGPVFLLSSFSCGFFKLNATLRIDTPTDILSRASQLESKIVRPLYCQDLDLNEHFFQHRGCVYSVADRSKATKNIIA